MARKKEIKKRASLETAPDIVIITGLSGSGMSSATNAFQDLGYFCVDNLPITMLPTFARLVEASEHEKGIERAALVIDIREGTFLADFPRQLKALRDEGLQVFVLFLEASDEVLHHRFSETRRPHPLGHDRPVREGLRTERILMEPIRKLADVVIETSKFNVHELRQFIIRRFQKTDRRPMMVGLVSFGYKFGIPADADLVFDVRFLPNPHFIPKLRKFSGRDPRVARYIRSFPQTGEFLRRVEGLLIYLIPHYIREGKSYLTIAFGCTGGRHRSVMLAEAVHKTLHRRGYASKVAHRDLDK